MSVNKMFGYVISNSNQPPNDLFCAIRHHHLRTFRILKPSPKPQQPKEELQTPSLLFKNKIPKAQTKEA